MNASEKVNVIINVMIYTLKRGDEMRKKRSTLDPCGGKSSEKRDNGNNKFAMRNFHFSGNTLKYVRWAFNKEKSGPLLLLSVLDLVWRYHYIFFLFYFYRENGFLSSLT
jgi:hypothetical protein